MEKEPQKTIPVFRDEDIVTVTEMGHIVEVQYMFKENTRPNIKKLNKDEYIDLKTGEIRFFDKTENRSQLENSLLQTFKKLRYLINNNFKGSSNELHIVLTYHENITDYKRLYADFKKFIKKLRYKYDDVSKIEYINVVEPQGRGAWHCHLLLRFDDLKKVYIPNEDIRNLWGNGFVMIKSLKDIDNIGAYLSAYLADIELTEKNSEILKPGMSVKQVDDKKFIKGGRLHMYPSGMNIYRTSRGIKPPERKRMSYKKAKKIVGSAEPHYSKTINIENDDFSNTISYLQYNLKR